MLPKVVWEMPSLELSTFTLHPTQLSWSCTYQLINGETKTGVTTFIDDKIDTGAMILSSETPIEETENEQLHDRWIWEVKLSLLRND
jgi:methionyl-tRNA formyltransferase